MSILRDFLDLDDDGIKALSHLDCLTLLGEVLTCYIGVSAVQAAKSGDSEKAAYWWDVVDKELDRGVDEMAALLKHRDDYEYGEWRMESRWWALESIRDILGGFDPRPSLWHMQASLQATSDALDHLMKNAGIESEAQFVQAYPQGEKQFIFEQWTNL